MNTATASLSQATLRDNLITTIHKTGRFTQLLEALHISGLAATLKGSGPFTLFAPDDAAFAKLGAPMLVDLHKPEHRAKLMRILKLHVVLGQVAAVEANDKPFMLRSVQGGDLAIDPTNGFTVNQARIVERGCLASNGVAHVIDSVLMPAGN